MATPLSQIATRETIDYALDRASAVERKFPMLALVYRVVAEVLEREHDKQAALAAATEQQEGSAA